MPGAFFLSDPAESLHHIIFAGKIKRLSGAAPVPPSPKGVRGLLPKCQVLNK